MKILIVVILTGLLLLMGCHYPEPQDAPQLLTTEVGELVQCGDFTIARERYMVNGVTLLRDSYFIHSYQGQSPDVRLPETASDGLPIETVAEWAFAECDSIQTLTVPDSYRTIQTWAFTRCENLREVRIGAGIETLDIEAFSYCNSLDVLLVDEKNTVYESVNNCILLKEQGVLVAGCRSSVIPEGTTVIGDSAFSCMETLTTIVLPRSVTRIEDYAFFGCTGLTEIRIPLPVEHIGFFAFHNCPKLTIYCETQEKPGEWDISWDGRNHGEASERFEVPTVMWGVKDDIS